MYILESYHPDALLIISIGCSYRMFYPRGKGLDRLLIVVLVRIIIIVTEEKKNKSVHRHWSIELQVQTDKEGSPLSLFQFMQLKKKHKSIDMST